LYPKADCLSHIFCGKAFVANIARDPTVVVNWVVNYVNWVGALQGSE
jgi:hypothetical protein